MLGMNNRFSGNSQVLKKFIDQGELGEIYYARCGWIRRSGIPGFGGWFTTKERSGGGPLIDIGVHALDVTLYFMGSPAPVSVVGSTYAKFGPRGQGRSNWGVQTPGATSFDVEDMAVGFVKLAGGATLVLEVSWASHVKAEGVFSHLFGTEGGADWSPLTVYKNIAGTPVDITPAVPKGPGGHEAEILHFCECIVGDRQPISTAQQGLHVLQILDALYRSAQSGREVVIGE
jgi:predicted dehydrogenase